MRPRAPLRTAALALGIALVAATGAFAYFSASGAGSAGAAVGTFAAPSITSTTPGAGTVALSWSTVSPPSGSGTVKYYVTRNGGAPAGNCPTSASPTTATSCTDSGLTAGSYTYTVTAVWQSWSATSAGASVSVSSGALNHFSVVAPASATAGSAFNVTVTAQDAANNTVIGYTGTIHFTSSDGQASLPANYTFVAGDHGSHTFTSGVTLKTAGSESVSVNDTAQTGVTGSATVNVAAATAASLTLSAATQSPTAGAADNLTIVALDPYGNTATTYGGSKSLTFGGAHTIGSFSPTVTNSSGTAVNFGAATAINFTSGVASVSGSSNGVMTLYKAESASVTVTDGTISNGTGLAVTVVPAGASSFSVGTPGTQTAGAAFNETLTALDAYGNTATGYTGSKAITFSGPSSSPNNTTPLYPASVSFSSGVGTASITLYDAQTTTLTATQASLTGSSGSLTVGPAAANSFSVPTPATQTAGVGFNETITALDTYGNTATGYAGSKTLTFSGPSSSPNNTAPSYPASVSFSSGAGTASITLYDAQSTTLTATQGALSGTSGSFTVSPGAASTFKLPTPGTQTAGTAFNETITAQDAYGNTATGYTGSQTIAFTGPASSPNGTAPSYPASVTFSSGAGTASITLYAAQAATTLTATQGTVAGTSGNFTVNPGANHQIGASASSPQTAGTAFNVTLTAQDAWGNAPGTLSGTKNLSFSGPSSSPNNNQPTYPTSASFSGGSATVSVTLYDAQTTTITATDTTDSYNGTASNNITVNPATAASFKLPTPATQTAGTAFNETITALDTYGNTATGYAGSKTLTFSGPSSSPNNTAPSYPASVTFTSGAGTASITLYDAQSTTLTATQSSLTGTSGSFTVNPGANSQIAASASSPQTAGTAFNVTLTAQDAYGNAPGSLSGSKSIAFSGPSNSPNGALPSYPATATFSAGSATASVKLVDAQTTTITATDTTDSYNGVASNNITVNPASAASFKVPTPASQTAGSAFNETITAQDAYGNTATGYTGSQAITFSGPSNSPGGTQPSYPASVTFSSGVGTASITLYDAQSTTLTATQGAVTGASGSFTVNPGANHQIAASASSPQTAGTAFNVTLTAQDTWGNAPGTLSGTKNLSFSGPSSSPDNNSPTYPTSATFSGGTATVSVTLFDAQTTTITATDTTDSYNGTASNNITVNPATAASFKLPTPATQTAGTAFNQTITALDSYGNTATGYTGSQTITFTGPSNSPNNTKPLYPASVSFSSGVGTASITLYDAQSTTLTATQSTLTGTTGSFTVSPGAASTFKLPTPASQTAGTAFNETITAIDAYGNTATGYTGSQTITFSGPSNSPNGTVPSYPASVTFTNGAGTASITLYDAQSTTLTATQGTVTGSSGSFTVAAGANAKIAASASSPQTAGTAFNVTLTAQDAWGNAPGTLSGTKNLSFSGPSSSPDNNLPTYPTTASFSGGTATVSVTLYDAQTTTITATDTTDSYNGTASNNITVNPASATSFKLPTPATQTAGTAFNETITALDTYGNTATGYTGSQTITFTGPANSPNNTAPTYPGSVSFSSGAGTASITLYDAQTTTLTATQSLLTGTTGSFTVSPGAASTFTMPTPGTQTAGTAFNVTMTAHDAYGNTATGFTGSQAITFSGPSNSPNGTLPSYPASVTFTNGAGTASITLYDAQSATLTATQGSATGTTGSFTVNAASLSQLGFSSAAVSGAGDDPPGAATPLMANLGPITVQEQDHYGNPVAGAATVNLSSSSAGGIFSTSQFGSNVTSVSIASGQSSTSFYYGDSTVGTPTITASATGLTSGTQQETITTPPAGLGMALAPASSGDSVSCGSVGVNYTCNVTGDGRGGSVTFYATFVNSSGNPVVYSTTQPSTITESGQNSGTVTIAAGASSSNPNTLTASHTGNSSKTSTLTFGPYTLNISVGS